MRLSMNKGVVVLRKLTPLFALIVFAAVASIACGGDDLRERPVRTAPVYELIKLPMKLFIVVACLDTACVDSYCLQ